MIWLYVFISRINHCFGSIAFRDRDAAERYLETLPKGEFIMKKTATNFSHSDKKAYYAAWFDCGKLEDDKKYFGCSHSRYLYPTISEMIENDPMFKDIDPRSIIAYNDDKTCVSFVEDNAIFTYKIRSIDIV